MRCELRHLIASACPSLSTHWRRDYPPAPLHHCSSQRGASWYSAQPPTPSEPPLARTNHFPRLLQSALLLVPPFGIARSSIRRQRAGSHILCRFRLPFGTTTLLDQDALSANCDLTLARGVFGTASDQYLFGTSPIHTTLQLPPLYTRSFAASQVPRVTASGAVSFPTLHEPRPVEHTYCL